MARDPPDLDGPGRPGDPPHPLRGAVPAAADPRPAPHRRRGPQGRSRSHHRRPAENTFYASVFIERDSEVLSVDARPSDSIAVALRAKAPIFVNEKLLQPPPREEETEESEGPAREPTPEEKAEQLRRYLEKLNPEDFGKFQL